MRKNNKRPRDDSTPFFDFNPAKFARTELPAAESSDSSEGGLPLERVEEFNEAIKKVKLLLNPLLPVFKKHLGTEAGTALRSRLLQSDLDGDLEEQYDELKDLCDSLVKSWSGVEVKQLSEEEKSKLKGADAIAEWDKEVIELELPTKLTYYALKEVVIADDEEKEEETDAIPLAKLSLDYLRGLPYILASPEIDDVEKEIFIRLTMECDGLEVLTTASTPIMMNVFSEHIEEADDALKNNMLSEAFSCLFGLTKCMKRLDHWYHDFEEPKDIAKLMTKFLTSWNTVLKKSNDDLGISGKANFRNDLKTWIDSLAIDVKKAEGVKFNWNLVV